MKFAGFRTGILGNNVYILYSPETKRGCVVDPAGGLEKMREFFDREGITPEAVLLTHGHFDHISGLPEFLAAYPVPVIASEKEVPLLADTDLNLTKQFHRLQTVVPDRTVRDGEILLLSGGRLRVIETPGHTAGSVCFYAEEEKALFAGDTLFENSCGRTDFPTGNYDEIVASVTEKLFTLPPETAVFPGHGNATTIGREKERQFL